MRVSGGPGKGLTLGFEKPVDYHGIFLCWRATKNPGGFAILDRGSSVDCGEAGAVRQNDIATVGDLLRVYCTVTDLEAQACRAFVLSRIAVGTFAAAGPIHGYSRQNNLMFLLGKKRRRCWSGHCRE